MRKIEIDYTIYRMEEYINKSHDSRAHTNYYLRSFKASSVLCIRRNVKFLLTNNDQSLNTICNYTIIFFFKFKKFKD